MTPRSDSGGDMWLPCEHCGRIGPRYLTSDDIDRMVDAAIGYDFRRPRSRAGAFLWALLWPLRWYNRLQRPPHVPLFRKKP